MRPGISEISNLLKRNTGRQLKSSQYAAANDAQRQADESKAEWENKLQRADDEADAIIRNATETASYRADQIVEEAQVKAEGIRRRAENEAILTHKNAVDGIKREIVNVSSEIAEKMLEREINASDHRALINSFIDGIGEGDGGDH